MNTQTHEHKWKVALLSPDQLRDISPEDVIFHKGHKLFRRCNTYKGGGGYDKFPQIAHRRCIVQDERDASQQFVIQLYGCNLDCPYCYVTREGVWGSHHSLTSSELIQCYLNSKYLYGTNVFHLMGGAPGLQLKHFPELLDLLGDNIFHSDLLLTESYYSPKALRAIDRHNVLLALSVKGLEPKEYKMNTRKEFPEDRFYANIDLIFEYLSPERWYFTFTNVSELSIKSFKQYIIYKYSNYVSQLLIDDWFSIDLINYEATKFVDNHQWGCQKHPNTLHLIRT